MWESEWEEKRGKASGKLKLRNTINQYKMRTCNNFNLSPTRTFLFYFFCTRSHFSSLNLRELINLYCKEKEREREEEETKSEKKKSPLDKMSTSRSRNDDERWKIREDKKLRIFSLVFVTILTKNYKILTTERTYTHTHTQNFYLRE